MVNSGWIKDYLQRSVQQHTGILDINNKKHFREIKISLGVVVVSVLFRFFFSLGNVIEFRMCHCQLGDIILLFPYLESVMMGFDVCMGDILTPLTRITMETEASIVWNNRHIERNRTTNCRFSWWRWVRHLVVAKFDGSSICRQFIATVCVFTLQANENTMTSVLKSHWKMLEIFAIIYFYQNSSK